MKKQSRNHDISSLIQVDDFDVFKERMLGSKGKKPHPHKKALLFVDNSGADIVLGMLPLARELLRRGTEVIISPNIFLFSVAYTWIAYNVKNGS